MAAPFLSRRRDVGNVRLDFFFYSGTLADEMETRLLIQTVRTWCQLQGLQSAVPLSQERHWSSRSPARATLGISTPVNGTGGDTTYDLFYQALQFMLNYELTLVALSGFTACQIFFVDGKDREQGMIDYTVGPFLPAVT